MALSATEEAQARALISQQAAILSLAQNEAIITSKLGASKANLSGLPVASLAADTDLLLTRQGTVDKSISAGLIKTYISKSFPVRVSSIADLRALRKNEASSAVSSGYYAQGDGGAGAYWLDVADATSVDNGGSVIVATDGGRWKLVTSGGVVSVRQFGAKGDGVADDTAAIQQAINFTQLTHSTLYFKGVTLFYRVTAPLNITDGITIDGDGVSPYRSALGNIGGGSWIQFDHLGIGFNVAAPVLAAISGVFFKNIGTRRNQPLPVANWVPLAADDDINIIEADVLIDNLMMLNPTKGVCIERGRLEINGLRGQAFQYLVKVSVSYEGVKISNIHQFPFWYDGPFVHDYTIQNLDVIFLQRADTPIIGNIFTRFARSGIRFGQGADGSASLVHVVNADFDLGLTGIFVDTSVTTGTITGQFVNITTRGRAGSAGTTGVTIQGNNSRFVFTNLDIRECYAGGLVVAGSGSNINTSGLLRVINYNTSALGFAAVYVGAGNTLRIDGFPDISGGGTGPRYGGAGAIYVDEWRTYLPIIRSTDGVIASASSFGLYKIYNNTVHYHVSLDIVNNGTGSNYIIATLPTNLGYSNLGGTAQNPVGYGRELIMTGKSLSATVSLGSQSEIVNIYNFDNAYPGLNGARLNVSGQYNI